MDCSSRYGEITYLRGRANQVKNTDKTSFDLIYAQASFFREATSNMDLMRYDTLFFYYALTRIEGRTMSQPCATLKENIKLLLIALFCMTTIASSTM